MKHTIQTLMKLCLLALFGTVADAQIKAPLPSSEGSVMAKVGLTDVTIDYYRPKMKGRKIFGAGSDYLVPFGKIWRAGANSGSKLTISTDAMIAGKNVKAGKYLIFATPGATDWKFMLYSDLSLGGNIPKYDKAKEVLSATVKGVKLSTPIQTLTFNITDISEDNTSANIELAWADVSVKVPIKVAFDKEVMESIAKHTTVNPGNYTTAANYYLNTGKDLNKALTWINKYLAIDKNSDQFWHLHTKAKILAKMGKKKEAIATAKESMEKAKNFPQGDFGYIKRNEKLIASMK